MTDCLKIISPALFNTLVRIDTSVSSGTSQILPITVRYVLTIGILKAFSETKVNDED